MNELRDYSDAKCWCGTSDAASFFEGPWKVGRDASIGRVTLVKCRACGTVRTFSLHQVRHTSGDHDDGHYFHETPASWDLLNAALIFRTVKIGAILDVGCNTGQLMRLLAKRGLSVHGIESNLRAVEYARTLDLDVERGLFDSTYVSSLRYDAVVLSHVLEHIEDPIGALSAAARVLNPGGHLFVFVPNIASLRARLNMGTWAPLMPVDHCWHFSPGTLKSLVLDSGDWRSVVSKSTSLGGSSPHVWAWPIHALASLLNLEQQVALVGRVHGKS